MEKEARFRHDPMVRLRAIELSEQGLGWKAIASTLAISKTIVKEWIYSYRAIGMDSMNMGSNHKKYDYETRLAAVKDIESGLTRQEVMSKYGIASLNTLKNWCRNYHKGGPDALLPKRSSGNSLAIPKRAVSKTHERIFEVSSEEILEMQTLKVRLRKLEAENAYLKKVRALKAERLLTRKNPR